MNRIALPFALLAPAALCACSAPAETNAVAEGNAVAEANSADVGNIAAEPPVALNEAQAAPKAAPPAKAAPAAPESYAALGQEPGWALKIAGGRIDYTGNYGEKKISVARPEPAATAKGRRYVTPRLTVDITYTRCNDAMSGFGFEHQVTVTADGETYKGCGGARKKAWDM
ncbi:MAG: hypothetical protein ACJ8ER_17590 [Allosphingosinicella sp.]